MAEGIGYAGAPVRLGKRVNGRWLGDHGQASLRQVGSQQQPQEFLPLAAKRDHAVAGVLDVAEQDRRAMAGRGQLQG
ncbi:hypothetical protein AVW14_16510 [Stenotrophomonas maltophilia]|nr:hypothetical protein AVW14_16510 [Stenotrophomonas maltophilia]